MVCVCEERTNGFHCLLPLLRLGNHLDGHMQWALTTQKVCGTVLGGGGESPAVTRRCPAKVEPIGLYSMCSYVWAGGSFRAASGTTDSGAIQTPKILKEDKRFYRIYPFTDFSIRGQRVRSLFTPRDAPAVSRTG